MTPRDGEFGDLAADLGELLGRHRRDEAVDLEQFFSEYRDRPVAFAEEVLDEDPSPDQREALALLVEHDRVAWQAAQAVGKSRTIAYAALWWSYGRRGRVLISAPTARTVQEVVMRSELSRLWRPNPALAGDLYTNSLRIRGDEPSILAYTATSSSAATGQHDPEGGVLAILDEAQGVPPEVWVAMDANTTGSRDGQFVCGNPIEPAGDFFEVCQQGSGWATLRSSALEHPNLDPDSDREIPGGPSEDWLERMRDRWGEDSPQWTARVLGRFPETSEDALLESSWIEAAFRRHGREESGSRLGVAAVDVARHGSDRSCVCVRRGRRVESFRTWRGAGTTETARRAREEVERAHDRGPVETVVVDAVGVGGGVHDALEEDLHLEWNEVRSRRRGKGLRRRSTRVEEFKAGRRAPRPRDFANLASQAYWRLRDLLESDDLDLPSEDGLREELLALRREITSDSRVRIDKGAARSRLGHSPDLADALAMTLLPELRAEGELELIYA